MKGTWCGPVSCVLGTYPTALVCVLLYRFPIPLVGYASGVDALVPALVAVTVYGLMGGFVVQGVMGWLAGGLAHRRAGDDPRRARRICAIYGVLASVPGVAGLAVLDKIIGSW